MTIYINFIFPLLSAEQMILLTQTSILKIWVKFFKWYLLHIPVP